MNALRRARIIIIILLLLLWLQWRRYSTRPTSDSGGGSGGGSDEGSEALDFCTSAKYTDTEFNPILRYSFDCSSGQPCTGTFANEPFLLHAIRAFALKEGVRTIEAPPLQSYADFYVNLYQNCTQAPLCLTRLFAETDTEPAKSTTFTVYPQTMVQETVNKYDSVVVRLSVAKGSCD